MTKINYNICKQCLNFVSFINISTQITGYTLQTLLGVILLLRLGIEYVLQKFLDVLVTLLASVVNTGIRTRVADDATASGS